MIKGRNPDGKLKSIQFQNKCTNSYALKCSYCTIDLPKKGSRYNSSHSKCIDIGGTNGMIDKPQIYDREDQAPKIMYTTTSILLSSIINNSKPIHSSE